MILKGNIHWAHDVICDSGADVKVVRNMKDLRKETDFHETLKSTDTSSSGFKIGLGVFAFNNQETSTTSNSRSTDFEKTRKFFEDTEGEIYISKAKCDLYKIDISKNAKPTFTEGFLNSLRLLQKNASDAKKEDGKIKVFF